MARHDLDLYWVRVSKFTYPSLTQFVATRQAQMTTVTLPGLKGVATWRVTAGITVDAVTDTHLHLGDTVIEAQLDHLPTHAYRSLVSASPAFHQYPELESLYRLFENPASGPREFLAALEDTAASNRQPSTTPQLVLRPQTFTATWVPEQTFLRKIDNGHFFAGLSFSTDYRPGVQALHKVDVGLDLGMSPLTVAYTSAGEDKEFLPTDLAHIRSLCNHHRLSRKAQQLLEQLLYACGRYDTERVIRWLAYHARFVAAEELNHRGMSNAFVINGRKVAIHDHHFSSLSQYLNTAQIEFMRVDPAGTSQHCGECLESADLWVAGHRDGAQFRCFRCGWQGSAHVNAAHVILLLGVRKQRCKSRRVRRQV